MIRDAHSPLLTWAWSRYVHWKMRRSFRGLWVRGELPADEPIVLYANHANFWDGFVAHVLVTRANRLGYAMMEEQNLARFRFLRRLGAFSVRRGSASSARESLRHAAALLEKPRATVVIFPQGRIAAFDAPLDLERGAELLARWARVRCVPMAIRYAVFEHEAPDVLVSIGEAHAPTDTTAMASKLEALRSSLASLRSPEELPLQLSGRRSLAEAG
ncbi:MAG: lysophospholipid acyltransferase family protein [Archangium sp.]